MNHYCIYVCSQPSMPLSMPSLSSMLTYCSMFCVCNLFRGYSELFDKQFTKLVYALQTRWLLTTFQHCQVLDFGDMRLWYWR